MSPMADWHPCYTICYTSLSLGEYSMQQCSLILGWVLCDSVVNELACVKMVFLGALVEY